MKKIGSIVFLVLFWVCSTIAQTFEVSFPSTTMSDSFSGQILLYLSKENKTPKDAFLALELPPVFRIEVNHLNPNQSVIYNDQAMSYPVALSDIERGTYYVQAVFDRNLGGQNIANSAGNLFSEPQQVILDKNFNTKFVLSCNQIVEELTFKETSHLKELRLKSNLLSTFHDKEVFIAGAVSLPKHYFDNPNQSYPVVFSVFGFGANYKLHAGKGKYNFNSLAGYPAIVVYLDGNCSEGHSTYANSDINGPWGDALVQEFIPELQKRYRTNGANMVFGHSSGGWTSLWLQINYPETFSGAWASAPDQVDFRNWQGKNIYETDNMFYDANGNLLADITMAGRFPIISAKDLYRLEHVVYRGEQLHSFDAVFSKRDGNGNIMRLVNPTDGSINKSVLPIFKRYDLSYQLRTNWDAYKDAVSGKIRISMGEQDNFHLQEALYLFEKEMKMLQADIAIEYFPGDHFTVFTDDYKNKGQAFLDACYKKWLKTQ